MTPTEKIVKYNIGLLAVKQPENYVQIAQQHFSKVAQGYILSDTSLPHITICQYWGKETSLIPIINTLKKIGEAPKIHFTGLSFTKDQEQPHIWWAELSVAQHPDLIHLHRFVVQLLEEHQISPLNDSRDLYRPHLTFARIARLVSYDFSSEILKEEQFRLVLGEADDLGQFTKVIHRF